MAEGYRIWLDRISTSYGTQPDSNEAKHHEEELARFTICIKDEIGFQTMTYQDLFNNIIHLPDVDSAYVKYLERRYFCVSKESID